MFKLGSQILQPKVCEYVKWINTFGCRAVSDYWETYTKYILQYS
jgi:hypothetical protein